MNLWVGEQAERHGQSRQLFARMFVTAIELGAVERGMMTTSQYLSAAQYRSATNALRHEVLRPPADGLSSSAIGSQLAQRHRGTIAEPSG